MASRLTLPKLHLCLKALGYSIRNCYEVHRTFRPEVTAYTGSKYTIQCAHSKIEPAVEVVVGCSKLTCGGFVVQENQAEDQELLL